MEGGGKEGRMNSHDPLCLADRMKSLLQNVSEPLQYNSALSLSKWKIG